MSAPKSEVDETLPFVLAKSLTLYETPLASGLRQYIAETYGSVDSYLETHGAGVLQYLTETYV